MKAKLKNRIRMPSALLLTAFLIYANLAWSQLCSDNVNTVYGLTTAGEIYPVNINTGAVGALAATLNDGTANPPENANAIGYNSANNKFYCFYRCAATAPGPVLEFVSYYPPTNTVQILATPAINATNLPNQKMRSGCVNTAGTGYYTFEVTTGGSAPTNSLWYYNIAANTWTKIASSFKNGVTDYTASFNSLNSGDMAFDGSGNLWIIISNSTKYGLYKIPNPPTTAAAGLTISTVQQIISPLTSIPGGGGASFTGFSFNANGTAFLSTGSGMGANNNLLYKMTTASAASVTLVATIKQGATPFGAGDDFTSCSFTYVLPVKWLGFTANLTNNKGSQLAWSVLEDANVKEYYVERSTNGTSWQRIASIKRKYSFDNRSQYSYTDVEYSTGKNYYRIVQEDVFGSTHTSDVEQVIAEGPSFSLSPNPTRNRLNIKQTSTQATQADIYDSYGKLLLSTRIHSCESIDISRLVNGNYYLRLSAGTTEIAHTSFIKL
jgi:hypothetical protein